MTKLLRVAALAAFVGLGGAGTAAASDPLPLVDAHIHYSHDA